MLVPGPRPSHTQTHTRARTHASSHTNTCARKHTGSQRKSETDEGVRVNLPCRRHCGGVSLRRRRSRRFWSLRQVVTHHAVKNEGYVNIFRIMISLQKFLGSTDEHLLVPLTSLISILFWLMFSNLETRCFRRNAVIPKNQKSILHRAFVTLFRILQGQSWVRTLKFLTCSQAELLMHFRIRTLLSSFALLPFIQLVLLRPLSLSLPSPLPPSYFRSLLLSLLYLTTSPLHPT